MNAAGVDYVARHCAVGVCYLEGWARPEPAIDWDAAVELVAELEEIDAADAVRLLQDWGAVRRREGRPVLWLVVGDNSETWPPELMP